MDLMSRRDSFSEGKNDQTLTSFEYTGDFVCNCPSNFKFDEDRKQPFFSYLLIKNPIFFFYLVFCINKQQVNPNPKFKISNAETTFSSVFSLEVGEIF